MSSQIFGSGLGAKFGGKRVLLSAVLLWSFSTLLTPFVAPSIPWLIFLRVLLGIGEGKLIEILMAIF